MNKKDTDLMIRAFWLVMGILGIMGGAAYLIVLYFSGKPMPPEWAQALIALTAGNMMLDYALRGAYPDPKEGLTGTTKAQSYHRVKTPD